MALIQPNKTCLRKAKNQLEKHQMGFDGEHIGEVVLRRLGYKGVKLTSHKSKFDILTSREAWEIKTVGRDAVDKKMSVKAKQKLEKLAWAKKNGKRPKSMMVIVNDSAEVYIRDGLGKFRAGGMKKVRTFKDWRKEVGHGRTERLVEGKVFVPAKSIEEAEVWARKNLLKNPKLKKLRVSGTDPLYGYSKIDLPAANRINKKLFELQRIYSKKFDGILSLPGIEEELAQTIWNKKYKETVLNWNTKIFSDKAVANLKIKQAGDWLVARNIEDILVHEYGHKLGETAKIRKAYKIVFNRKTTEELIKNISRRSMVDAHEMWAEVFSKYIRGDKLPVWISNLIKEAIG